MNDDDLIRLYVELTGASEELARSALIHLYLYRYLRVQSTTGRQRVPVSAGLEGSPNSPTRGNLPDEKRKYEYLQS